MRYFSFVFLFIFSTALLPAQDLSVEEEVRSFSKGSFPSFQVNIPQATLKNTQRDWGKYIKAGSRGKVEEANGEIFIHGAVNKNISPAPFHVYSKLLETTTGVRLTVWVSKDDAAFVSHDMNNDLDVAVQKYVRDFAVAQYKIAVKDELAGEKEKLKKLEGDLKDFISGEEKSNKKINENFRSIDRNNTALKTNAGDQKIKSEQITAQKRMVEALKARPGDELKAAEKTLKTLEGELKQLEKDSEKLSREIDNWEKEIREEQRSIDKSKADQKLKNELIEQQQAVIKGVETRLAGIK